MSYMRIASCTLIPSIRYGGQISMPQRAGDLPVRIPPCVIMRPLSPLTFKLCIPTENQVTPFQLQTPDGETIYAWHIMPLPLYLQHEAAVATQKIGLCNNFTQTESFRLLANDPEARLIISCKYTSSPNPSGNT